MKAAFLLQAVRNKYPDAAIVPEVQVHDHDYGGGGEPYSRRIDALMFQTFQRTAIEIKVTVADFKRDTYAKRSPWQRITHRFIYVTPKGLKVTAPHGCGHWEVDEAGNVSVKKKAIVRKYPEQLPQQVIQALAYRASDYAKRKF